MIRKIEYMHLQFGFKPEKTCATCGYFREQCVNNKKIFKCAVYGNSPSEATDWRKKYEACGKWRGKYTEYNGQPLYMARVPNASKYINECVGQIDFDL